MPARLRGCTILVIEDEYVLATYIGDILRKEGACLVGPFNNVSEALELLGASPSLTAAVLDINLGDETAFPIADRLHELGVPFVFTSGHDASLIPASHRDRPLLLKPVSAAAVTAALSPYA